MKKKLTILLLALMLTASALAEAYEGTTAPLSTAVVTAGVSGIVQALDAEAGSHVNAGDVMASMKPVRAFAARDGSVSLVNAGEGDKIDGTLLELMPLERYLIYCTVDKAYQSAESTLVHSGETVYVRCTTDGSHRAVGVLTEIEGAEYRVVTLGGELYLGETVYLYRSDAFTASQRIGIGTVVSNDTQGYEASGTVSRLLVGEGDTVERGQLLYEINGGTVDAPVSGIVTTVNVNAGEAVEEGQVVAEIVPDGQVCVEIQVSESEASGFSKGQRVALTQTYDAEEKTFAGTVVGSAWLAEDALYTVRILPDAGVQLPLGMSVTVRTQED
ncbi:MAG: HlyD family efflux transporter periplasmic adaptor subunit [Clostridia bacterium]|nr:HlyD family efflux transporter periplasmic adaptor subunit [Clostridia bacterium]